MAFHISVTSVKIMHIKKDSDIINYIDFAIAKLMREHEYVPKKISGTKVGYRDVYP